ncbi:MAG: histidine kinase [Micavibrio aeruginosavorus]|uniref:histidine kinase n=1 Tax=Micavibrio aeruginosavorus TaxID=349221 RepID=A0A2W5N6D9_9BACT|nr:MAG: histidine kinase [Micavibrio aeruginosavorus]
MSGLTVRILAVNIIAIMILGLGILYLGQYTDSLIEGELAGLRSEAQLFSGAISEGAVRPVFQISPIPFEDPQEIEAVKPELARRMVRRLGEIGKSRIRLYAIDGSVLADSHQLSSGPDGVEMENLVPAAQKVTFDSLFTQSATRFLDLIPMKTQLTQFPDSQIANIYTFPDTQSALSGTVQASAWKDKSGRIILTVAAPIQKAKQVMGVVLLLRDGAELEKSIAEVRVDVFRVFLGSLGITVMLSIYLSGLISRPLQRLAFAAEAVRQGKGRYIEIPDMSHRNDEIGELSLALRDMTYALFTRMDTIERFAADVAHEIKNPLTSLRSAVETASRIKDEDNRKKLMDIIQHDVQRLDRLISDISSASRLDAELSRDEMGRVDIPALMFRLRDAYKQPLKRGGNDQDGEDTKIVLEMPEEGGLAVKGNTDRLAQVFGNLLSNALSFSPDHAQVFVRVLVQNDTIMVQVDDEGPGIPENKLTTIFERFYTERPDHEGYGNHSGLGLSISKQIVEAHGGQLWAENRRKDDGSIIGARFNVVLNKLPQA